MMGGTDSSRIGPALSFLDVLTCAFGGIVLVFLILLSSADSMAEPQRQRSPGLPSEPPLIILLTVSETDLPPEGRFTIEIDSTAAWEALADAERVSGYDHAFLTVTQAPPPETTITIRRTTPAGAGGPVECRITLVADGQRTELRATCEPNALVAVWPLAEAR